MRAFGVKVPPTFHYSDMANSNIWLADIRDQRRELLNIKKNT